MQSTTAPLPHTVRRNAAGFTLIEIAVVVFLMALIALLIIPSTATYHVSRLKHETRRLAGRAAFLYDQAASDKLVLRLTFDIDAQSYFVSRLDPHALSPVFTPDLEAGAEPILLPPDVHLRDVTVEGRGTVARGSVNTNFYPEGYVDATVVHLADAAGIVFTLSFQPLTGRVSITRGDLDPKVAQANS
jgi:type II secretory pathway pseudopilin PulG